MIHTRRRSFAPVHLSPPAKLRLVLLLTLLFALALPFQPTSAVRVQDEDEVEKVTSELVVLNVTVTDGQGKFVRKLQRGEFKVFEDGVEQTINTFAREENPFAAAILIDTSGSMESRVTLARAAAIIFLGRMRADDVASVYHFHSKVERLQDFSNGRDLPPVAYDLRSRGMTRLNDAVLEAAKDLTARPETRRAILLLSDGSDTQSRSSIDTALNAAITANATVYTVNMADPTMNPGRRAALSAALRKYAEKSGGRFVDAPGGQALYEAFEQIVEELSNQYTLGYRPSNHTKDGRWRAIEVRTARTELKTRTRSGYRSPKS
ncbi:MAG TPA: VWA domain-containing protein [Pyrinomonadaceae bacterium]|nr:VWA domain-containing protein [Pyrinomonadaceae bacterium]